VSAIDDELVEVVAEAIADVGGEILAAEFWELYRDQARAVLSVPALRDALARDAQVREIVAAFEQIPWPEALRGPAVDAMADLAALYPEVAT